MAPSKLLDDLYRVSTPNQGRCVPRSRTGGDTLGWVGAGRPSSEPRSCVLLCRLGDGSGAPRQDLGSRESHPQTRPRRLETASTSPGAPGRCYPDGGSPSAQPLQSLRAGCFPASSTRRSNAAGSCVHVALTWKCGCLSQKSRPGSSAPLSARTWAHGLS